MRLTLQAEWKWWLPRLQTAVVCAATVGLAQNPHTVRLDVPQGSLQKLYGGGKFGNQTGWICGTYRGKRYLECNLHIGVDEGSAPIAQASK